MEREDSQQVHKGELSSHPFFFLLKPGINYFLPPLSNTVFVKHLLRKSDTNLPSGFIATSRFLSQSSHFNLSHTQPGMRLLSCAGRVKLFMWSYPGKRPFCAPPFPPHSSQGEATTRMCNSPSPCSSQPVRRWGGQSSQAAVFTTSRQHGGLTRRLPRIHSEFLPKYLKQIYWNNQEGVFLTSMLGKTFRII